MIGIFPNIKKGKKNYSDTAFTKLILICILLFLTFYW